MTNNAAERILKSDAERAPPAGDAASPNVRAGADVTIAEAKEPIHLVDPNAVRARVGGTPVLAGFQDLAKAYQDLAAKNAEVLAGSIRALATVKTPSAYIELQRKLISESLEMAMGDFNNIARLTIAAFTSSFEPRQKHRGDLRSGTDT